MGAVIERSTSPAAGADVPSGAGGTHDAHRAGSTGNVGRPPRHARIIRLLTIAVTLGAIGAGAAVWNDHGALGRLSCCSTSTYCLRRAGVT